MILSRKQVRILLPLGEAYDSGALRPNIRFEHERTLFSARHFLTTPAIAYPFDGAQCRCMLEWIARAGRQDAGIERTLFSQLGYESY
jgi:hypothetical protein